ncbi:glutathione S-transferase family protein [Pseudovibrio sp. Alg231-02]|uniref:glutathione S-transferase family protein n=1 Tax=Pseudovibrio sp. Alg231-02 TaxID=1922223 RepID=UPI000D54D62A|nr:glutathione S-transferase family protein [Pseudovibrio sp. Alg231-02]
MKLYNSMSGNTKRVRIFISEKDISIPRVELELGSGTRTPEYRKINSLGEVPALELDDGRVITESRAICRFLDIKFPKIPLMGVSAFDQGNIAMWSERIHSHIFMAYGLMVRHAMALFAEVVDQVPEFAETQRQSIPAKWIWLNDEMSDRRPFIAGDTFSFADVEGMTALMLADAFNIPIPGDCSHVLRWADTMRNRPSWEA